jgi:carboxyl-terminal processing protease
VGDEIISVNGKSVQGKSTGEVSALLKGQAKTEIELKVRRYGKRENLVFKIVREKISITNMSFSGLVEPDIGYIRLDDFTPGASQEVSQALVRLKAKGATKVVLDLRNNPGGLLHEAVNIVGLFIPKGREVVSTKGKVEEWNKKYKTLGPAIDTNIPIAVLVGDGSASASEIVAGALQDYDRALLVGGRTFGKGLVQTSRPLAYGTQLKITTAKYYIPSGRCIQALDYAHRKDDGSVERTADSLKLEFKTKNGRKVFDGGGLDPDVMVEDEYAGTLTSALVRSGLIFEFASKYCGDNPQKPDFRSFQLTDKDFEQFVKFLKEQKFSYQTSSEKTLSKLFETAKKEPYYKDLEAPLSTLKSRVDSSKESDFQDYRTEIIKILKEQIAFHYGLHASEAEVSLHQDNAIIEARKLLRDTINYNKLLSAH